MTITVKSNPPSVMILVLLHITTLYPTFLLACRLLLFRRLNLHVHTLLRVQLFLFSLRRRHVRGLDDLDHLRVVRSRGGLMTMTAR